MSTTITRLYQTEQQAREAARALQAAGFQPAEINLVTATADLETDSIVAAILKGGVPAAHADVYAQHVRSGASLLTVHAPYGRALSASQCLHRFNPLATAIAEPDIYESASNTDGVAIPTILRGAPSARLLGSDVYFTSFVPLIIHDAKPFSRLSTDSKPFSKLLTNSKPFSGLLQGTLSSWLGIPTVLRDRAD